MRTTLEILIDLREATRARRAAEQLVEASDLELRGRQAHLTNVNRYRMNLHSELSAAIEHEAAAK